MTNLIDDIKRDREAGTRGSWVAGKSAFEVFNADHGSMNYEIASGYTLIAALYSDDIDPDARRIARVPAMEEALLAAVELEAVVDSIFGSVSMGEELDSAFIDVETSDLDRASMALTAFRKALEAGQ